MIAERRGRTQPNPRGHWAFRFSSLRTSESLAFVYEVFLFHDKESLQRVFFFFCAKSERVNHNSSKFIRDNPNCAGVFRVVFPVCVSPTEPPLCANK